MSEQNPPKRRGRPPKAAIPVVSEVREAAPEPRPRTVAAAGALVDSKTPVPSILGLKGLWIGPNKVVAGGQHYSREELVESLLRAMHSSGIIRLAP